MLTIRQIINSPVSSNCYIISCSERDKCIIIDPGSSTATSYLDYLSENALTPQFIILTHQHFDHCASVNELRKVFPDTKLVCSKYCNEGIQNEKKNFSLFKEEFKPFKIAPADIVYKEKGFHAAGSNGVTKVSDWNELEAAVDWAINYSFSGDIIIESFIEKQGCSSDSDCFSVEGRFKFMSFSAQRFDEKVAGEYTPAAYSWPSTLGKEAENELSRELQRLITLLGMRTSVYNVETRVCIDGKPYIMEISPRGGGNRLSEMMRMATGVDMITAAVRAAVGEPIEIEQKALDGSWAEIIVHADQTGILDHYEIAPSMEPKIIEKDFWAKSGNPVKEFQSARDAIGTLVMRFDTAEELEYAITHQREWLKIVVK